jgi:hypothetical protein
MVGDREWNCRNILGSHDARARGRQGSRQTITVASGRAFGLGGRRRQPQVDDFETPASSCLRFRLGRCASSARCRWCWISTYAKVRWRLGLRPRAGARDDGHGLRDSPARTEALTLRIGWFATARGTTSASY